MTICLDVYVTGGMLGTKLANEPEETWYCLMELASDAAEDFCTEVADHASGLAADTSVIFLRKLADAIENRN